MSVGSIRLAEVAARTDVVLVSCRICHRNTRLMVTDLLDLYGSDMPVIKMLRLLAFDCPRLTEMQVAAPCDAHFPDLRRLF